MLDDSYFVSLRHKNAYPVWDRRFYAPPSGAFTRRTAALPTCRRNAIDRFCGSNRYSVAGF